MIQPGDVECQDATVSQTHHSPLAFASTVHDPDGRLVAATRASGHHLGQYDAVHFCVTDATTKDLVKILHAHGATVKSQPVGEPGFGRRSALRAATADGATAVFACDFDRWLHWIHTYPDELADLPRQIASLEFDPWYVCIGRSARAFATHPEVQRVAERATNRALEVVVGRPIDATSGASWLSPEAASIVVVGSTERTLGTDLEWPALVHRAHPDRVTGISVEGLEFETASYFVREIEAVGGPDAWVRLTYDRPQVWSERLRLAADSVAALARVLAEPTTPPISGLSSGEFRRVRTA